MLNKNDPLIGAVQQVMKRNNVEREAVKTVNEYFGIEDRKALPHERQGEWNAAYQQILSESTESLGEGELSQLPYMLSKDKKKPVLQQLPSPLKPEGKKPVMKQLPLLLKPKGALKDNANKLEETNIKHPNQQKLDVHEPEKDKLTAQDFKMLRAKKKTMEEKAMNPYAVGMAAVKKSTGDEPPMEKKNITKAHKIAKMIMKKKMEEEASIEDIQEEIAYNLAEQAAYVYENYGEEGLVEFYNSLTEEQIELLEGWGNQPGSPLDRLSKWFSGDKSQQSSKTSSAIQDMNKTTHQQAGTGQSGPNRGLDQRKAPEIKPEPVKDTAAAPAPTLKKKSKPTVAATPAQAKPVKKASTMGGQISQRDADLVARAKAGGGKRLSDTFKSGKDRLAYLQARARLDK
jgi:hypothetical protein